MADFFKNETKRRITAGIVTGVMAFSTVISTVTPALAETADTGTPTTNAAPANPAPAETPQPATTETETPAAPTASTEESTPGAITPTEETSTVTAGTPEVATPPAAPTATTEKWDYVFDTNGGSFADGSTTKTVTLDSDSASVNSPATPSKPGMTFVGWADLSYTDSKGIKGVYTVDASQAQVTDTTDVSGNVTHTRKLYAIYQIKLTVTGETEQPVYRFDANGGHAAGGTNTIIEVPATSGTTDNNVPAPTVVRDGYDFVGWGKAATSDAMSNLGVTNVNFMSVIAGENPMTLERDHDGHVYHTVYAIWKQSATPTPANPTPANPATAPTSTHITFTQDNIPNVRDGVPTDKMAVQFVSDVSLNGTKFVGAQGTTVTAPSGLTDPDGRTVVKWVTDVNGGDEMAPGETREIDTVNGETFHAVWQPKDGNDDVQYRLVINANGGHFEGGIDVMNERHDFLPADMPNVKAATKMTRDGFTLAGFSYDKNGTVASARSLTEAMGIRDAEHIPGHTKDGALPGKTDEIYTLYAIWKDNSQTRTDEYRYVFMGNGGHVADDANVIHSTVVRGNDSDVAAISAPAMVRDGYTFVGWGASNTSTEAESLGVNSANFSGITADESVDGTTDVHVRRVYAIWKQNAPATQHKNTYIFDANGGTITGSTDTTSTIANANPAEATNVAAPKAEKAGYTFVGWAKDPGASTTFVLGNDHVDFSSVGFTVENDTDGSVVHVYKVYAVYKVATPDTPVTPPTPGTGEHVPTDGVPPTLEPVAGKNTIMFYSGKLNKGETSVTNTGEHADVVAPNREYSLADGTMVKRWISTDGTVILLPGGHYDADSIKDKVFVADYVTATPPDYDPTQNYPQNVSHIQLHFHANGGKGEHGETVYAISGDPSATDLPVRPTFTREGYTFKGWSRNGLDTEVNVIVNNNMVNLKSIGKRSEMTDPQDPHKVIVVYNVYAVWQKDEVTPDNPVTPPTPDTPGGHNGNITPGEPGGGTGTVTPDNPVTPGTDGDNYLGIPIHHTQGEPQYINTGNGGTTTQSDNAPQGHWVRKRVRRNALPNTGDAASATGIIAGIGAILASLGLSRKRKNQ
jgi:LPXTG-motif cell wall-anchored protein